jgi:arabinogalactan endo-1,4-beta-galactosidase
MSMHRVCAGRCSPFEEPLRGALMMDRNLLRIGRGTAGIFLLSVTLNGWAQQPPEPVDPTPQDGQAYALMNQSSGLQLATDSSGRGGSEVTESSRNFGSLAQRWALTRLDGGAWKLTDQATGLCLAENPLLSAVQVQPCAASPFQSWLISEGANGYSTLKSAVTGRLLTESGGEDLRTALAVGNPSQTQQWQLRPAFWRGADIAEQEKMEALRLKTGLPWWKDAEQPEDILKILKDHGFNSIRLRPTSIPPYYPNQAPNTCTGNSCSIDNDAQELDVARRARSLGFSLELTLFFDGGSSQSIPGSWAGATQEQLATNIYNYTKAELEMYRKAGLMPDMVSIGNEVDTGFLGGPGFFPFNHFAAFAALEKAGLTAVADAASDTSIGPALPSPLTCIHITPGFDMTSFFTSANANGLTYDAICQSYYPIFHGPLTDAQAAQANPNKQPVEADMLLQAAQTLGKPIYILETGEHYEPGFDSLDPWYAPTRAAQRQFLLDLESVVHSLPGNLAMGIEYWAPNDVEMPDGGGPFSRFQQDFTSPNALFEWEGLALFDSADPNFLTNPAAPNYSTVLPGMDAVGGKLDATLHYKLTNRKLSLLLGGDGNTVSSNFISLLAGLDGIVDTRLQWSIASDNNGAFTIANLHASENGQSVVVDAANATAVTETMANGSPQQSWDVQTAGDGYFYLVNQSTGQVLGLDDRGHAVEQSQASVGQSAQWAITPVAISGTR